ncbi:unnamed protein product [Mytilus coruscus]|uniref:Uncharacterized protein n=1 Tax=Mytilus coruscus TaxID=42192 RepID=A0A6J8EB67_MYTCO|nr:unnamed protein product [Mytilus coruscus]
MTNHTNVPRANSIGYFQVIDASPTDLNTVTTVLQRSVSIADKLSQLDVVIVFDQAIYAKALEIIWQKPVELERKHYNRALRSHKIVFEAFERLCWEAYGSWLSSNDENEFLDSNFQASVLSILAQIRRNLTADNFKTLLMSPYVGKLFEAFSVYCNRSSHGFSRSPVDQTIEQTLNRDTKTRDGIVVFSLNKGSVKHWLLNAHERASISSKCRYLAGMINPETSAKKELGKTRMKRDETDVLKLVQTLQSWTNQFETS